MRLLAQHAVKPGSRYSPVALYGPHAYIQGNGDLFFGETGDKTHFNNSRLTGIDSFEAVERFVQCQELHCSAIDADRQIRESHLEVRVRPFFGLASPGVIDENAPHHSCGYGEKVGPAFPVNAILVDQSDVNLMDQISGLKAARLRLADHSMRCQPVQLAVDKREQLVFNSPVSFAPLD
jgi:hypothetical protein